MNNRENTVILYGSYGYTGRLIAQECKRRGLNVILSGRKREPLYAQSISTGFAFEVVDMDDAIALKNLLVQGSVLIHCGGPFQFTAEKMVETCLSTGTHYTDISGEYPVFETLASYDVQAKASGITVIPGTGFDVVPSDCLALYLKNKLQRASKLELAFTTSQGGLSRGTAYTMVHGLGQGSVVRKGGKLVKVPLGEKIQEIDFGEFKSNCMNIPWGDVSTAWFSTGIPDIEVYVAANTKTVAAAKASRYINSLLKTTWVKNYLLGRIRRKTDGPAIEKLNASRSYLWGRVSDKEGNFATATIQTLGGYLLTAKTSVNIAEKILSGDLKTGYQTPSSAYGADLILEIENTVRKDL